MTSPSTGNFHISTSSPCYNAGTSASYGTYDFDDQTRVYGSAVDIGADEVQQ